MSAIKYCQSCGMPLDGNPELYGTEDNGEKNEEYCCHCYQNGQFTRQLTMDEMINMIVPFLVSSPMKMEESAARSMLQIHLPNLKRWASCHPQEDMERKATELLDKTSLITLSSITSEGYPRSCILVKISTDGFRTIRVSTGNSSRKTREFLANSKASISYGCGADGVTLIGNVRVLQDKAEKAQYWQPWMASHFPGGTDDPDFCVLEFTAHEATLWIENIFRTYSYLEQ